jgi:NhaA family Na+:H+ antiporter
MSGIHATIAGVLLAFLVPHTVQQLEHTLQGIVTYLIVPLFAIANAGVTLSSGQSVFLSRIALGIVAGLVIGKPLGIMLASYGVVKAKIATLPPGVSWRHLHASSWLAGIGFTMSLFVAGLAFRDAERVNTAKLGVLLASTIAGTVGYVLLRRTVGKPESTDFRQGN